MKLAYQVKNFGVLVTIEKCMIAIKSYMKNQLKANKESEQLSIYDLKDTFYG